MRNDVKRDRAYDSETSKIIFVWELDDIYENISTNQESLAFKAFEKARGSRYSCTFCGARIFPRNLGHKVQTSFIINSRGKDGPVNEALCTGSCSINEATNSDRIKTSKPILTTTSDPNLEYEVEQLDELVDEEPGCPNDSRSRNRTDSTSAISDNPSSPKKTKSIERVVQFFLQAPDQRANLPLRIKSSGVRDDATTYAHHFTYLDVDPSRVFYKKHIFFGFLYYDREKTFAGSNDDSLVINFITFEFKKPIRFIVDLQSDEWPKDKVRSLKLHLNSAFKRMDEMQQQTGRRGYITVFGLTQPAYQQNTTFYIEKYQHIYVLGSEKKLISTLTKYANPMGSFLPKQETDDPSTDSLLRNVSAREHDTVVPEPEPEPEAEIKNSHKTKEAPSYNPPRKMIRERLNLENKQSGEDSVQKNNETASLLKVIFKWFRFK